MQMLSRREDCRRESALLVLDHEISIVQSLDSQGLVHVEALGSAETVVGPVVPAIVAMT